MSNSAKQKSNTESNSSTNPAATSSTAVRGKNRTYPNLPLEKAVVVARVIQDRASGMTVTRLRLADLMDTTPTPALFGNRFRLLARTG